MRFNMQKAALECCECGSVSPIIRKKSRIKEIGHIKDLWCYKCKKDTKHIENENTYY